MRAKLGLALFAAVAAFLIVDDTLRGVSFRDVFRDVERSRAKVMVLEARGKLQDLSYDLGLAARSDRSNLSESERGRPLGLPGVSLLIEADGRVVDLVATDHATGQPTIVREIPGEYIAGAHPFLSLWRQGRPVQGLFETSEGFLIFGSAEVTVALDEDAEPTRCLSVLGVWITPEVFPALSDTTSGKIELVPIYSRGDSVGGVSGEGVETVPEAAHPSLAAGNASSR